MIFTNKKPVAPTKAGLFDSDCKKIILTTDQALIKNSVQSIDDEFLEWFVNNPSCEEVKVDLLKRGIYDEYKYKIIIPSKEDKIYNINDLQKAFLKGYAAKNNKEDYPFALQKFLNSDKI